MAFQNVAHDLSHVQQAGLLALAGASGAILAGLVVDRILFAILRKQAKRKKLLFGALVTRAERPAMYILPLLAVLAVFPNLQLPTVWVSRVEHVVGIATIAATAWAIVVLIMLFTDYAKGFHRHDDADNLRYRQIETRVDILSRVAVTVVVLVAAAIALMTFPEVRSIGATLLASAGLAGLAVGLATRPLLENLVAGVQIALTQPIRIDDVVIVESQYGRIEEITSTYVVVALWDKRRMILPLTYFIDKPFENWTRRTTDLMGTVMIYANYTTPVEAFRVELDRVLPQTPLWDGKVKAVQLTDCDQNAVQIRVLVSASNASNLFDLRCYVREKMIDFMQRRYPAAVPSTILDIPVLRDAMPDRAAGVLSGARTNGSVS